MSGVHGNDSAVFPEELTDIAWKVDALIREHGARDRFREMIAEAENQHRRRCNDERDRQQRRLEHFEIEVQADPRLRDLEAGPPEPDWVWEWEETCQLEAWVPPEFHQGKRVDTSPPLPLPEREMSLAENYLVLGALRDYVCKSEEKLLCWEDLEGESPVVRLKSKGASYLIWAREISKLRPEHRKPLEAFLQKVEEDLRADCPGIGGRMNADDRPPHLEQTSDDTSRPDEETAKPTCSEVKRHLKNLCRQGKPYTSERKLAEVFGCSARLVGKAINSSDELKTWKTSSKPASPAPRATALSTPVVGSAPQSREPDPSDVVLKEEVDIIMARLIQQAAPEERAELNALDADGRRKLALAYRQQGQDYEPSSADPDPSLPCVKAHRQV